MSRFYFLSAFLLIFLSSCSPVVYSTIGHTVPLFHSKGETALAAGYGETEDTKGFYLQGAAAAGTKWLAMVSLYSFFPKSNSAIAGHGTYLEGGAGRFGSFGTKRIFIYEFTAGAGFAGARNSSGESTVDMNFIKPFIQPSVGIRKNWYEVALTPRFGFMAYTAYSVDTQDENYRSVATEYFRSHPSRLVFEPGLTVRAGCKNLKLQLQYNVSTFTVDKPFKDVANANTHYLSVGLHYFIPVWL